MTEDKDQEPTLEDPNNVPSDVPEDDRVAPPEDDDGT